MTPPRTAIPAQFHFVNTARLTYEQHRESGIASFTLPKNIERRILSIEQLVIHGFITIANDYPSFLSYLGIHSSTLQDQKSNFYSIFPLYRGNRGIRRSNTGPLENQCKAISLFLKSGVSEFLTAIDLGFQNDWKIKSFFSSIFQRNNYLNNRRAPRFVILALSNLLWNLQHPIDSRTGFPLSREKSIEMCGDVERFLDLLIDPHSPPYVHTISDNENELMRFLHRVKLYTKNLREAYAEELPPAIVITPSPAPARITDRVNAGQVLALTQIITDCFNALSSQSKNGSKGLLLRKLEFLVSNKADCSEAEIKQFILELIRITASYRETWFFQSGYGQTRSAKALIAAIKDPTINRRLPLASIVFGSEGPQLMQASDDLILQRLKRLRAEHGWDYNVTNMQRSLESRDAENRVSVLEVH